MTTFWVCLLTQGKQKQNNKTNGTTAQQMKPLTKRKDGVSINTHWFFIATIFFSTQFSLLQNMAFVSTQGSYWTNLFKMISSAMCLSLHRQYPLSANQCSPAKRFEFHICHWHPASAPWGTTVREIALLPCNTLNLSHIICMQIATDIHHFIMLTTSLFWYLMSL